MRARFVSLATAVTGLALVGTGATFAYTDNPEPKVTVAQENTASDGVGDARSSLQQASLPLSVLGGGVGQLTDGSRQLDDGAHQLSDGLTQARDGGQQLADGLAQLDGGVALLGDGATQVSGGVDEVVERLTGLGEIQGDVTGQLTSVAGTLALSPDPISQQASGQITGLVGTLNAEGLGPDTLEQLQLLRDGARQLAWELTDPEAQFVAGMNQAADGSRQLVDGLVLLDDGGRALTAGTGQLVDGVAPVDNVVQTISENVKTATDALPQAGAGGDTTAEAAAPTVDAGDRSILPYALIALGAVVLAAPTVVTARAASVPTASAAR